MIRSMINFPAMKFLEKCQHLSNFSGSSAADTLLVKVYKPDCFLCESSVATVLEAVLQDSRNLRTF
jgi:hypothetical protein